MKTDVLKKFIKEAVREAIQEELKDILLEAVRSPKQIVRESNYPTNTPIPPTFTPPTMDLKQKYKDVLGETALSFTSNDVQQTFRPQSSDPVNGNLGTGELGMEQIMGLVNTK